MRHDGTNGRRTFLKTAAVVLLSAIAEVSRPVERRLCGGDAADHVWRDFEDELAGTLSGLDEGQFLILVKQKTSRSTQSWQSARVCPQTSNVSRRVCLRGPTV